MTKKEKKEIPSELSQAEQTSTPSTIYTKLHAIQSTIGQLEKTRENKFQKYFYAGEYDLLKVIKPLLKQHRLVLIFSDRIDESTPLIREKLEKEWLVQYLKKAELINVDNPSEQLTYYFWTMAHNIDLAKAKGSAETYAIKYFLQKFFLIPTDNNLDPDAFDSSPKSEKEETRNSERMSVVGDKTRSSTGTSVAGDQGQSETSKLPPKPTITSEQVEALVKLFIEKRNLRAEVQTNFFKKLDEILLKTGHKDTTNTGNLRVRCGRLTPLDYQYLYNWLMEK